MGAKFTRTGETDMMHLTREGGHTHRRVVHAADATGAEVSRALLAAASAHSNIRFFESHQAVDFVMDEVIPLFRASCQALKHFGVCCGATMVLSACTSAECWQAQQNSAM